MRFSKKAAKLCRGCGDRPALFMRRGEKGNKMRWRKDHDLCGQCMRAERNRSMAG